MNNFDDTIIGIATAQSQSAISIIRVSGIKAIEIVNKVFKGCNLTKVKSHTINYGHIIDPTTKQIIDEVLVSVFRHPKSYTCEDVVEINCHGGLFVTNQIYELLVLNGTRPATPGEFTKRAFLNGRIDLTKAEAVMDVISAENKEALKIASYALNGKTNSFVTALRQKLLDVIANIAVNIDYPEYDDVEELTNTQILPVINEVIDQLKKVLDESLSAKMLKNGINTVIVGKPNVGKSSLLNAFLNEQKAIVTDIPGTTRDIVEAQIQLKNVTLNLIDTAGIRKTADVVEKIGVEKSLDAINKADLIIFLLDGSDKFTKEDEEILSYLKDKTYIMVVNKADLEQKINLQGHDFVLISTKENQGLDELEKAIIEKLHLNNITNKDITYISNARQIEKINNAYLALKDALDVINDGYQIDIVDMYIKKAWLYLGEIIGEASTDNLLDELFSKFCLGK